MTAQVLWGLAYTFTSGATTAWLTAELGDPDTRALSSLFLRLSRLGSIATLVALPCAWLLAGWSLRTPLLVAGGARAPAHRVVGRGHGRGAVPARAAAGALDLGPPGGDRQGRAAAPCGRGRVLLWFAVFAVVVGGASEAYDRLYEAQLLGPVGMPTWFGWSPLCGSPC